MSTERAATYGEVFAVREFRVLFGSFALLVSGDSIKMLALSVLVYAESGSPGLAAAAYMVGWLPYIVGGMFLLSLADRLPARGAHGGGRAGQGGGVPAAGVRGAAGLGDAGAGAGHGAVLARLRRRAQRHAAGRAAR
ncbi:hypothetical protein ACFSTC_07980 [Nonomuraea ferruginea]